MNTTYTTGTESLSTKPKTQRMNPDTDINPNPSNQISCKDIIIGKLRNARKKYLPDIHYTHQNCPKFEFDDEDYREQKSLKITNNHNLVDNHCGECDEV
jgi:hypothetical protein